MGSKWSKIEFELKSAKIFGIFRHNSFLIFEEICDFPRALNVSKRNVLKVLAMFYQPIGFLQPIIINL